MREYIEDWIVEFNKREGIMDSSEVRGLDVGRLISKLIQDEQVLHPDLQAFYSVFHPNDPVAYRIEPLVSKSLSAQKPSPVPYTKGGLTGLGVNISELASRATGDITGLFGSLRTSLVSTIAFKRAMLEVDSSKDGDGEGDSGDDEMRTPEEHDGVFTTSSSPRTPMLRGSGSLSRLHQPPAPKFTTEEILGRPWA